MDYENKHNKKVLLRERKRHTARRVSSAPRYAGGGRYPIPGLGGVPHPRSKGGTPSQVWGVLSPRSGGVPSPRSGGLPSPRSGRGTPSQVWGVPHPDLVRRGYPLDLRWGTPQNWDGVPPSQT